MTKTVDISNVVDGMSAKDQREFAALLGEDYKDSTNSRSAQLKRWNRYLTWERNGRRFVNIKKRDCVIPEAFAGNDLFSKDVLTILVDYFHQREYGTFTMTHLLAICGFLAPNNILSNAEASALSERWGFSYKQAQYFVNELSKNISKYCVAHLKESLQRIADRGYMDLQRDLLLDDGGTTRRATSEEREKYESLVASFKKENGLVYISPIYNGDSLHKYLVNAGFKNAKECYSLRWLRRDLVVARDSMELWNERMESVLSINETVVNHLMGQIEAEVENGITRYLLLEHGYERVMYGPGITVSLNNGKKRMIAEKRELVETFVQVDMRQYEQRFGNEVVC